MQAAAPLAEFVAEVLLLQWPQRWVAHSCTFLPRHNRSLFSMLVRKLGRALRQHLVPLQVPSDVLSILQERIVLIQQRSEFLSQQSQ